VTFRARFKASAKRLASSSHARRCAVKQHYIQSRRPRITELERSFLPRGAVLALRGVMMQNIRPSLREIQAETPYQSGTQIAHLRGD
jgi:hypothetical protein